MRSSAQCLLSEAAGTRSSRHPEGPRGPHAAWPPAGRLRVAVSQGTVRGTWLSEAVTAAAAREARAKGAGHDRLAEAPAAHAAQRSCCHERARATRSKSFRVKARRMETRSDEAATESRSWKFLLRTKGIELFLL